MRSRDERFERLAKIHARRKGVFRWSRDFKDDSLRHPAFAQ